MKIRLFIDVYQIDYVNNPTSNKAWVQEKQQISATEGIFIFNNLCFPQKQFQNLFIWKLTMKRFFGLGLKILNELKFKIKWLVQCYYLI